MYELGQSHSRPLQCLGVLSMVKCPKCKEEIDHLDAVETREIQLIAKWDPEAEQLDLENTEEWGGGPIGEQTALMFSCPKCHVDLFHSEPMAVNFLAGAKKR